MEQQIINNAFFMIAIKEFFDGNGMTEEEYENKLKQKDLCIGIVTDIKTSPYYINKKGKYLAYILFDRQTKKCKTMLKKNKLVLNNKKNQLNWMD